MLTVFVFLAVAAAVICIMSAVKPYAPLWISVLLLCLIELLRALPAGR